MMRGYVYIHKIGTGKYEAVGYDWQGFLIIPPTYDRNYNRAYNRIYSKLKIKK